MDLVTMQRLLRSYKNLASTHPQYYQKEIDIVWHGGEPLLAGREFYGTAIDLERKEVDEGLSIGNEIQTTGVLIDKNWAAFFKENNFSVGISIDGPKRIHDQHRKLKRRNVSSFECTMRGIDHLNHYGVPCGALSVITKDSVDFADEIIEFVITSNIQSIDFLPCIYDPLSPDSRAMARFWIRVFDLWYPMRDTFSVLFLVDAIKLIDLFVLNREGAESNKLRQAYAEDPPTICELSGVCGRRPSLLPDGALYPCECLILDDFRLGNIHTDDLSNMLESKSFKRIRAMNDNFDSSCAACRYSIFCGSGCIRRRFLCDSVAAGKDKYCLSRKLLFDHIADAIDSRNR